MVKRSTIIGALALIALIGGVRAQLLNQTISVEPEVAIQAQVTPSLPDVRRRLGQVRRRLQEGKLAFYSRPLPNEEYIETQREIARGEYRKAMGHLNQA
jgi:hypothetical protein